MRNQRPFWVVRKHHPDEELPLFVRCDAGGQGCYLEDLDEMLCFHDEAEARGAARAVGGEAMQFVEALETADYIPEDSVLYSIWEMLNEH